MVNKENIELSNVHISPPKDVVSIAVTVAIIILMGILCAFILRFSYRNSLEFGDIYSYMMFALIYLSPIMCGAVTVYCAEQVEPRRWSYYIFASMLSTFLFLVGAFMNLLELEYWIWAVVFIPFYSVLGGAWWINNGDNI